MRASQALKGKFPTLLWSIVLNHVDHKVSEGTQSSHDGHVRTLEGYALR